MPLSERQNYEQFFEKVLVEYGGMILRVVGSYERSRALQEELYQEISVALWKALAKFEHQSSLKTYILGIAHKRAISHVAMSVKVPQSMTLDNIQLPGENCPSEAILKKQRVQQLMAAIWKLPMTERQLITLALEGLSYKEISLILGLTVSNVGAKFNRAKSKLNKLMSLGAEQ